MEDDHLRYIPKSQSGAQRSSSPLHIFRYIDSRERADRIEIPTKHRHVAGAGVAVALDVQFESIGEDALISCHGIQLCVLALPDPNIPPEDCARRQRMQ